MNSFETERGLHPGDKTLENKQHARLSKPEHVHDRSQFQGVWCQQVARRATSLPSDHGQSVRDDGPPQSGSQRPDGKTQCDQVKND